MTYIFGFRALEYVYMQSFIKLGSVEANTYTCTTSQTFLFPNHTTATKTNRMLPQPEPEMLARIKESADDEVVDHLP